jgi:hypothetical protein
MQERVRKDISSEGSDVIDDINDIPSDTSSWSREHLTALKIHYSNGGIETAALNEKYKMLLLNSWEKNKFEYASDEQIKTLDKSGDLLSAWLSRRFAFGVAQQIASIIMKIKYISTGPAVRVDGFMMSLLNSINIHV